MSTWWTVRYRLYRALCLVGRFVRWVDIGVSHLASWVSPR